MLRAAAERDRQVLEVAAHADALGEDVERGPGGARVGVAERDLRLHPVADGLHPRPAPRGVAEQLDRNRRQQIDLAKPASHQVAQRLGRQIADRHFARIRADRIRQPASSTTVEFVRRMVPCGATNRVLRFPNKSSVLFDWHLRFHADAIGLPEVMAAGRVNVQQRRHRQPGRRCRSGCRNRDESA